MYLSVIIERACFFSVSVYNTDCLEGYRSQIVTVSPHYIAFAFFLLYINDKECMFIYNHLCSDLPCHIE